MLGFAFRMRDIVQKNQIDQLLHQLAIRCKSPGRIYLVEGIFEAIYDLKDRLQINIELASPDNFMPVLPGWEERSQWVASFNHVEFYHYDFYSQALSKILRGHTRDLRDVQSMLEQNLINPKELKRLFKAIEPKLITYPSINPKNFKKQVEVFFGPIS